LFYGVLLLSILLVPASGILVILTIKSYSIYQFAKSRQDGVRGRIFRFDPDLGLATIPGSRGAQLFPIGPEIPHHFDENGFRIPADAPETAEITRPLVLALGCSFSFGGGCPAEKAYGYLVGQALKGTTFNASGPAYGLAQMVILARKLIPRYKPELVLVQYSPWLAERSQTAFMPSWYGKEPGPYFARSSENKLFIHPPVFRARVFDLPISDYQFSAKTLRDFCSFSTEVALPLYTYDSYQTGIYYTRRLLGIIPAPVNQPELIVESAYEEIGKLCKENQSRMVIVILTNTGYQRPPGPGEIARLNSMTDAIIVNAESALVRNLPEKTQQAYDRAYHQYRGNPPVLVYTHPNESAHQIIAEEILKTIQNRAILLKNNP